MLIGMAQAEPRDVTVYAAASLTSALQEVGAKFNASGETHVRFSFAASSLLARQIEAGADADLFFSADTKWMNYLAERGLILGKTRTDLLGNRLVLIAPQTSKVELEIKSGFPLAQALGDGRLAVADPNSVPAGRYARQALTSLGVWNSVAEHLLPAENVRVALAYVARGEAPLGIVYGTDARVEPKVKVVAAFPDDSHEPIVYPVALTIHATSVQAKTFLEFVKGKDAADAFRRYGFVVLR
ncbi:MAG: molybdate ABC transporter substrate-binding protein [Alphaproteobacteria bacterium]|nr:molybdate ABC transporter substrate-binding protein [Alphaproteobacteria bacterium]